MDRDSIKRELATHLTPTARARLLTAVDAAYRDAGTRFDPAVGCDAQWLGFSIWKMTVHRLAEAAADEALGLRVVTTSGQFKLGFGPFLMATYSCGLLAPVDPWTEFPHNDKGAGLLSDINTGQFSLDIPGFDEAPPTTLVLAHYGNHESGLEALYLKVPSAQRAGQICEWSYVEEIWRVDGSAVRPPLPDFPRSVPIERPTLTLKPSVRKPETGTA